MSSRVIHRADYQNALLSEAKAAGATIRLGAELVDIDFDQNEVVLLDGRVIKGDIIVGADGM